MTTFDWSNNYFKISGTDRDLNIEQKLSGSVIVPECNGTFLLLKIWRKDGQTHLEFPRGFQEPGEDLAGTAERELREETSLSASSIKSLGTIMPDSSISNRKIGVFLVEVRSFDGATIEKKEQITGYNVFTQNEIEHLIANNKIIDGYTLSAFTKLMTRRRDLFISRVSSNVTIADNRSEM